MDASPFVIPAFPQGLPFVLPVWFLKTMLVAGFFLHAIPMNVALMGGLVSAAFMLFGRLKKHEYAERFSRQLAFSVPFFVSVAITQGIVPLLFLQMTYGPMFYTSSILMATPWLSVILLLFFGYVSYYLFLYRHEAIKRFDPFILMLASLFLMGIAFMFTNNTTLMLTPEKWAGMYHMNPYGTNLNLTEPQLVPRYLHFLVAALAVTGLTVGCFGWYWHKREHAYGAWLLRTGAAMFFILTLLQIPIGAWFLLSLPREIMLQFMGRNEIATAVFGGSMVLDVISLVATGITMKTGSPRPFSIGVYSAVGVVLLMIIMRHLLRDFYVSGVLDAHMPPVHTETGLWIFFLISFVGLIAYIAWLVRLLWRAYHTPNSTETV
jgi:hypothetical protein